MVCTCINACVRVCVCVCVCVCESFPSLPARDLMQSLLLHSLLGSQLLQEEEWVSTITELVAQLHLCFIFSALPLLSQVMLVLLYPVVREELNRR